MTPLVSSDRLCSLAASLAGELAIVQPGSDAGVVPLYSMLGELKELLKPDEVAFAATDAVLDQLGEALDRGGDIQPQELASVARYVDQLQCLARYYEMGNPIDWGRLQELWVDESQSGASGSDSSSDTSSDSSSDGPSEPPNDSSATPDVSVSAPEDQIMVMDLEDSRDVLEEFYQEADEHLQNIEAALLGVEEDPADPEPISSMFRSFHTIKGVAGFLDLVPIRVLAHEIETLLDLIRSDKIKFTSDTITLVLESRDRLSLLLQEVLTGLNENRQPTKLIPVHDLIERAKVAIATVDGVDKSGGNSSDVSDSSAVEGFSMDLPTGDTSAKLDDEADEASQASQAEQPKDAVSKVKDKQSAAKKQVSSTIRMNTDKLDAMIEAVGELVIVESQLLDSIGSQGEAASSRVDNNLRQLSRITRELQNNSMSLRMVSVKPLFQRMQRLARDVAAKSGKKINFRVEGEETEMDRTVVEQIGDPLVHMIRNSVDHGIEMPEKRLENGKPAEGELTLKASYVGESIVLELFDDGAGISSSRVLDKAIKRGLANPGQDYTREEIIQMVFLPGFSTAETVSDFSGRGVGMDVVRSNVQQLRGRIDMKSIEGKGSHTSISLPLTMAIIDGLLVRCGTQRYVIPVSSINITIKAKPDQIFDVQSRGQVIKHRDRIFNLIYMSEVFGIETDVSSPEDGIVVMLESSLSDYGLIVDEILHKQEVVIKQLGSGLAHTRGVSGGAILGDGTVALILDPSVLAEIASELRTLKVTSA